MEDIVEFLGAQIFCPLTCIHRNIAFGGHVVAVAWTGAAYFYFLGHRRGHENVEAFSAESGVSG